MKTKNSKKNVEVDVDKWSNIVSAYVVEEVLKLFAERGKDTETTRHLEYHFLAGYTAALVFKSLKSLPDMPKPSKEEKYEHAKESFGECKLNIQNAVSSGFQGALDTWSGKTVEYYCQITPVPEPVNKREH